MADRSKRRAERWQARIPELRAKHYTRMSRQLRAARVALGRGGGGTPLTEAVVLLDGQHRGAYSLYSQNGVLIGTAGSVDPTPPHRERVEMHLWVPDGDWDEYGLARHRDARTAALGDQVLSLLIADRFGDLDDLVLDRQGVELVRLQNAWRTATTMEPGDPLVPGNARRRGPTRLTRWFQCLGLAPRRVIAGDGRMVGWVTAGRGYPRAPRRLVLDHSGRTAAVVTRTVGGTTMDDRFYVVDLREPVDVRLRATALVVGFLWDWYTIAWEAGG